METCDGKNPKQHFAIEGERIRSLSSGKFVGVSNGCINGVHDYAFGQLLEGQPFMSCGPTDDIDGTVNPQQEFWTQVASDGTFALGTKAARKTFYIVDSVTTGNRPSLEHGPGQVLSNVHGYNNLKWDRWGFYGLGVNQPNGSEQFVIVNQRTGTCMEVADNNEYYRRLTMQQCDTTNPRQQFFVPDAANLGGDRGRIQNVGSGKFLGFPCVDGTDHDGLRMEAQPWHACPSSFNSGHVQELGFELIIG